MRQYKVTVEVNPNAPLTERGWNVVQDAIADASPNIKDELRDAVLEVVELPRGFDCGHFNDQAPFLVKVEEL